MKENKLVKFLNEKKGTILKIAVVAAVVGGVVILVKTIGASQAPLIENYNEFEELEEFNKDTNDSTEELV